MLCRVLEYIVDVHVCRVSVESIRVLVECVMQFQQNVLCKVIFLYSFCIVCYIEFQWNVLVFLHRVLAECVM